MLKFAQIIWQVISNSIKKYIIFTVLFIMSANLFTSCIDQKSITYFNNIPDSATVNLATLKIPQPLIQVNDVLNITIGGESEKTLAYINQYLGRGGGGASSSGGSSGGGGLQFTVSSDGFIDLPKIGKIQVIGLTRDAARDTITNAYKEYLIDPIISVEFNNFKFTIIGEVSHPGTFTVTTQQINLLEAMAQAGDMTVYSDRKHVKLLRDSVGIRKIVSLDFTQKDVLNSPYYYLNRNDIIYVEAKNLKIVTDNFQRTATFIATIASVLAISLVIFKK